MVSSGIGIWDYTTARLMKKYIDSDEAMLFCNLNLAELNKQRHYKTKTFFLRGRRDDLYSRNLDHQ